MFSQVFDRGLWSKPIRRFKDLVAKFHRAEHLCQYCHPCDDLRYFTFDQKPVWPRFDLTPMWFNKADSNAESWFFNPEARISWLQSEMYSVITEVASWKNDGGLMGLWKNHAGVDLAQALWLYGLGPGPMKENRTRVVRHVDAMRIRRSLPPQIVV